MVAPVAQLSVAIPVHGTGFAQAIAAARAAEAAGIHSLWVPDHLVNLEQPRSGVLECWTTLAAVAAATTTVGLGTLVLTTCFRHPPLLAKQAATLAGAAPGRLRLGLGAGGFTYSETCRQLGFPELRPARRLAHCEETVRCLRQLLREDPADFHGDFADAQGARIHPRPPAPIPIVIAARAPRMLELVARVADGWNCPAPPELGRGLAAIERAGRAPETLQVGVFAIMVMGATEGDARRALGRAGPSAQLFGDVESEHLFGTPVQIAERIRALAAAGADEITIDIRGTPVTEALDMVRADLAPLLAG